MSFDELYDSCFRNASLVRIPQTKSKDGDQSLLVTMDHVLCNSQFIAFILTSGNRGIDLALKVDNMVKKKNERSDKDKTNNSPARIRRFFSMKKKSKKKEIGEINTVSVVLIDTEYKPNEEAMNALAHPGWYIFAPQPAATKSRLLRALGFEFPPSLIIVDTHTRSVVTTEGRRLISDDVNGTSFPWWSPSSSELLKGSIIRKKEGTNEYETADYSTITAKVRGFFFGAFWCPPCRQWVTQLSPVFENLKKRGISIEIIFCSSDRSLDFFQQFLNTMPWCAFSYDPSKTVSLTRLFNVSGIPALILTDDCGNILSRHGRPSLLSDPQGLLYPWGPQPLYELDEFTVCRLRDEPSLVLFTEGTPEDIQFSVSVLDCLAKRLFDERIKAEERRKEEKEKKIEERENNEENGNALSKSSSSEECSSTDSDPPIPPSADPLQVMYTGEDPICDHILENILGLGDAELPLICIVDGLAGQLSICEQPDVSEQVLDEFVLNYRSGRLKWIPLPTVHDGNKTVAGIPASVLEQALVANSPSQNSFVKEEPQAV